MEEIIKVENLCFEYEPGLQTISNISFQIHKGEYVAILAYALYLFLTEHLTLKLYVSF